MNQSSVSSQPQSTTNNGKAVRRASTSPDLVRVEECRPQLKTCQYVIRDKRFNTRLPEDIDSFRPSNRDPLTAPMFDIADDFNNFGGGVNPMGKYGHTFTENGFGPVYVDRGDTKKESPCSTSKSSRKATNKKTDDPREFDVLLNKIIEWENKHQAFQLQAGDLEQAGGSEQAGGRLSIESSPSDDEHTRHPAAENDSEKSGGSKCGKGDSQDFTVSSITFSAATQEPASTSDINIQEEVSNLSGVASGSPGETFIGPLFPFGESVPLRDLGQSKVLGDWCYLVWRMFFTVICVAATAFSASTMPRYRAGQAACIAMLYVAAVSVLSLRRALQCIILTSKKSEERLRDLSWPRSYSWVEVFLRQHVVLVCVVVGILPWLLFNYTLHAQVSPATHSSKAVFYLTVVLTGVSSWDVALGAVPSRVTYIIPGAILSMAGVSFLFVGFPGKVVAMVVGVAWMVGMVCGFLLHLVYRLVWTWTNETPCRTDDLQEVVVEPASREFISAVIQKYVNADREVPSTGAPLTNASAAEVAAHEPSRDFISRTISNYVNGVKSWEDALQRV